MKKPGCDGHEENGGEEGMSHTKGSGSAAHDKSNGTSDAQESLATGDGEDAAAGKEGGRKMQQTHQLNIDDQFKFLQVICYKRANKCAISQAEYKALDRTFQQRQGAALAMYVFTCLMLPMQIDRKVVENYVMSLIDSVAIAPNTQSVAVRQETSGNSTPASERTLTFGFIWNLPRLESSRRATSELWQGIRDVASRQ